MPSQSTGGTGNSTEHQWEVGTESARAGFLEDKDATVSVSCPSWVQGAGVESDFTGLGAGQPTGRVSSGALSITVSTSADWKSRARRCPLKRTRWASEWISFRWVMSYLRQMAVPCLCHHRNLMVQKDASRHRECLVLNLTKHQSKVSSSVFSVLGPGDLPTCLVFHLISWRDRERAALCLLSPQMSTEMWIGRELTHLTHQSWLPPRVYQQDAGVRRQCWRPGPVLWDVSIWWIPGSGTCSHLGFCFFLIVTVFKGLNHLFNLHLSWTLKISDSRCVFKTFLSATKSFQAQYYSETLSVQQITPELPELLSFL